MSFNNNQNDSALPTPGSNARKSENLLPKFFRTDSNKKFLGSTVDQLIQPGVVEKINAFVGRRTAKTLGSTAIENYLPEVSADRENYQFEPALVSVDDLDNVNFYKDYNDYIGQLKNFQGNTVNHSKLNSQEFYVWNPSIDFDKFTNFREYYWLPTGPQSIPVYGQTRNVVSTYTVTTVSEGDNTAYVMTPNGFTRNPNVTLYRGQTYKFDINAPGYGFAFAVTRTFIDTDPTTVSDLGQNVSSLYKKGVKSDTDFVEQGILEFTVPDDAPDTLYYVSQTDINTSGVMNISNIEENSYINIDDDIIGKKTYKSHNGVTFSNGMRIYFQGNTTPKKYSSGNWIVEGVGDAIMLVHESDLQIPIQFTTDVQVPFDTVNFDSYPLDDATGFAIDKDYIVINRASIDKNPWSRYNKWFHKSVIEFSAAFNGQELILDQDARAKRPIIEFDSGLKLFNYGSKAKEYVDLVDVFTPDVFSTIEGSTGYNVDGVQLSNGMRVLFTADTDAMVSGKIYTVKFITHNGKRIITLIETVDSTPNQDETVLVKLGSKYRGSTFFYNNGKWRQAQYKTSVNQHPVFDLYDADGISFSDPVKYPSSSFQGNRVFGYKIGTGVSDSELGFPLSYQNISNIGDIVFSFDLLDSSFTYQNNSLTVESSTDTGFLKKYNYHGSNFKYVSAWVKSNEDSKQYVIRQFLSDGISNEYPVDMFDKSASLSDIEIKVYVDGVYNLPTVNYTTISKHGILYVVFNQPLTASHNVVLKAHSGADKNSNGFYEIPLNFERNPMNKNISTFTLGEVNDHVNSIVEGLPEFNGKFPGTSNLRDIGNHKSYGRKFVQHSGPVNLSLFHITDKNANAVKAIKQARHDYGKFKKQFIKLATESGFHGTVCEHVTHLLELVNFDKTSSMPYYASDMVPYIAKITRKFTVMDLTDAFYPLEKSFDLGQISTSAVMVYLNDNILMRDTDYIFTNGFVKILANLVDGDTVTIDYYDSTNASFVPPTPTKLGLYPAYTPMVYLDTTFSEPTNVIQGHDGSVMIAYNDYRDDLILELEKRIYNNLKTVYDPDILDIHEFLGSKFRDTGFSAKSINNVMITDFSQWMESSGYPAYDISEFWNLDDSFTYNYKNSTSPNGDPISGYWRNVYINLYNTDRPHITPWEIQGFSEKPIWWESVYGPAPYTSDNLILWTDIEKGIIRKPGSSPKKNKKYERPGILKHLPVDENGNLLSPYQSSYAQQTAALNTEIPFEFGDCGPIETAWRRSSEYPFAVINAWMVLQPAKIFGIGFDRANMVRDLSGNLIYAPTNKRIDFQNFNFPQNENPQIQTGGIVNYVSDYLADKTSRYSDYKELVSVLKNQLAFKVGGFAEKEKFKLILDSRTPLNKGNVFVPDENYHIFLNKSSVLETVVYSGVIIEKTNKGFVVSGYDKENPMFAYNIPVELQTDPTIVIGGISEGYNDWAPLNEYVISTVVKYNGVFYRTKITHVSTSTFDFAKFVKLPSLPLVGGNRLTIRNKFNPEVSYLMYGTTLSTIQEVVDFMLGYQHNLIDLGFKFEYFNNQTQTIEDWVLAAKEFVFWTTQNWDFGSVITLSPVANKMIFEKPYYVVDNIHDPFYNYKILKSDGTALDTKLVNTLRDNSNQFSLVTKSASDDGIYYVKLPLVQKEHAVIVDNETVFNDVIYDAVPGYRQERLLVVGYRTDNWNGSLNIPGFIYDQAKVKLWNVWTDYAIGDVVKYKEFYYSANVAHSSTDVFDSANWNLLASKPKTTLTPNWEYKTNQITDFYSLDTDNFDTAQQELAQHLIGYQKRQYLENIITDSVSQYKFYQGFIQDKGTLNSLGKLFDALSSSDKDSLEFYEEWAIRVGQYGATDTFDEVEFILDESKYRLEPQTVELVNYEDSSRTDLVYQLPKNQVYYAPKNYQNTPFPASYFNTPYTGDSGYVNPEDVNYAVSTYLDILSLDIKNINIGDYVWVLNEHQSWNVYSHVRKSYRIVSITSNYPGYTIEFDKYIDDISVGDIFGIYGNSDLLDGFYVADAINLNKISVTSEKEINNIDLTDSSVSIISVFESKRFADFAEANSSFKNNYYLDLGKIWVDAGINDKWGVYKNQKVYSNYTNFTPLMQEQYLGYGKSISTDNNNSIIAIGAPDYASGFVYIYTRPAESIEYKLTQLIQPPSVLGNDTKFGYSVSITPDTKYILVGAPYASNVKTKYVGEHSLSGTYSVGDIVSDRGTLWKAKVDVTGDQSTITDLTVDWEPVYSIEMDETGYDSGLVNQGAIHIYERDSVTASYIYSKTIVSPNPSDNELFGYNIKSRISGNTVKTFVGTPGANRIYFIEKTDSDWNYTRDRLYKGEYNSANSYRIGEIVYYDGDLYVAKTNVDMESFHVSKWSLTDNTVEYVGYVPNYQDILNSDTPDIELFDSNRVGVKFDVNSTGSVLVVGGEISTNNGMVNTASIYRLHESRYVFTQNLISENHLENYAYAIAINDAGDKIAIGAPNNDVNGLDSGKVYVYIQDSGMFIPNQELVSPAADYNEMFGAGLGFSNNKLVISSKNGDLRKSTYFDNNSSVFDNNATTFVTSVNDVGKIYVYEELNKSFLYSDNLEIGDSQYADLSKFTVCKNHIYVAFPEFVNGSSVGKVLDFRAGIGASSWSTISEPVDTVDVSAIKRMYLYNIETNEIILDMDYVDPRQGKIPGPADQEIDFKTLYDPAVYSINENAYDVVVDTTSSWTNKFVGKVWWDLSNAKWYNPYQGNTQYRVSKWNELLPDASIDVYEWVESDILPSEWDKLADTALGIKSGISGRSLYGDSTYSERKVYNSSNTQYYVLYYFWVKNKKTIPQINNRKLSIDSITNFIVDPASIGYRFVALLGNDRFAMYNCKSLMQAKNTVFNVTYFTSETRDGNVHNEYQLVTENLKISKPVNEIERKWIDSLVGYDKNSNTVPDITVPFKNRYGTLDSPRQSWFTNRIAALKQAVERINSVFIENNISDIYDISGLYAKDNAPILVSGLYDESIDSHSQLRFVSVAKVVQAQVQPIIENGKIVSVRILNPGRGYKTPPTMMVSSSSGTGAILKTEINNLGKLVNVIVVKSGKNYSLDTRISARKFSVLVNNDETADGKWSIFDWDNVSHEWNRTNIQSYDAAKFWQYVDWYATGYSSVTKINHAVSYTYELAGLEASVGDIVKVASQGSGGWAILEKTSNIPSTDYTVNYKTVARQNGTIQLSTSLYNFAKSLNGFDSNTYDVSTYDKEPVIELRKILETIKNNIFVGDLEVEWNKLFFSSIRYVLSEQLNVDWVFKTSFVRAKHNYGMLHQSKTFKNDNLSSYEDYVSEVKPYSTKIREYISSYENIEPTKTGVYDFDNPAFYNTATSALENTNEVYANGIVDNLSNNTNQIWLANTGYTIVELRVAEPGDGYTTTPEIIVGDGTVTAKAYLTRGSLGHVEILSNNAKFLKAPTVTINGSQIPGSKPAKVVAILGENLVRSIKVDMKFDRILKTLEHPSLEITETFVGSGAIELFKLKWPADILENASTIFVNGIEILKDEFDIVNVSDTTKGYTRYTGLVKFKEPPVNGGTISVTYNKDINLLTASDRVNLFYKPTANMPGNDLAQVMVGVDYSGVNVTSYGFGNDQGFGAGLFGSIPWDTYDPLYDDATFILDGSTTALTMPSPLADGVIYNIYKNNVRLDDINFEDSSGTQTNPNAVMPSIVGDGSTKTIILDPGIIDTADGDVIIIRKSTSDGSFTPKSSSYDAVINGGNLAYTSATGIASGDINVDGDGFVTPTTSGGPEELVPGQVADTLDISVYHKPSDGAGIINSIFYALTGGRKTYPIPGQPLSVDSIIVKINDRILEKSEYTVNYPDNLIDVTDSYVENALLSILTIGANGKNIIDTDRLVGSSQITTYELPVRYRDNIITVIALNGNILKYGVEYEIHKAENNSLSVVISKNLISTGDIIDYAVFDDTVTTMSTIKIDNSFIANGTKTVHKFDGIANTVPFNSVPISNKVLIKVNDNILKTGYNKKFISTGLLSYSLDDWQFKHSSSINESDLMIFVDGKQIENTLYEWNVASYTVVFSDNTVAPTGSEIEIYIVPGGDYYFVNTQVSVYDTNGTPVDIESIISPNDTVTLISYDGIHYNLKVVSTSTNTILAESFIAGLKNKMESRKDFQLVYGSTTRNINIESVTYRDSSILTFASAPTSGANVEIYQFSNHDIDNFERISYDVFNKTKVTIGSEKYITRNLLSAGLIKLNAPAYNENYTWVIYNGRLLTQNADYILTADRTAVQLTNVPKENDTIEVLHFNTKPSTPKFGFRIFKDMLNRVHYKRLDKKRSYKLTQPLNFYDSVIHLDSTAKIFIPSKLDNVPGVLFIDGERIEYFVVNGNTLTQLRRGTLGTGVKSVYSTGTVAMDQSIVENIDYKDQILTQILVADGSTIEYALDFIPQNINEIEVHVAGKKLRKNELYVYDGSITQDSPEADVLLPSEFTINFENNTLVLTSQPLINQKIIIVRKIGKLWNVLGKSLLESDNQITKFLLGTTIELPK